MQLTGNWLLAERLVTTILYKLLRLVFITVQRIYWQLNGTAQKLREARLPHNYDRSAHVLDVILWHKFYTIRTTTVDNFLCTHNRFEDPQYIIDNENITLMTITERDAVFCETKEKGKRREICLYFPNASGRHIGVVFPVSSLALLSAACDFASAYQISFKSDLPRRL